MDAMALERALRRSRRGANSLDDEWAQADSEIGLSVEVFQSDNSRWTVPANLDPAHRRRRRGPDRISSPVVPMGTDMRGG
jgi:hypothetical protein